MLYMVLCVTKIKLKHFIEDLFDENEISYENT